MVDVIGIIEKLGGFASSTMIIMAFVLFFFKPLREWLLKNINKAVGTDKQNERLQILEDNQKNILNLNNVYKETLKLMLTEKLDIIIDEYRNKETIPVEIKKKMLDYHKLYQENGGNGYYHEMIDEFKHKRSE